MQYPHYNRRIFHKSRKTQKEKANATERVNGIIGSIPQSHSIEALRLKTFAQRLGNADCYTSTQPVNKAHLHGQWTHATSN